MQNKTLDELRVEIEKVHLEMEQERLKNESFRLFLEQWDIEIKPWHEGRLLSRKFSFDFAMSLIKTIFLLNGGALIAFPAFAQLIGVDFQARHASALFSAGSFVAGLVLICITTLLAHCSMNADSDALWMRSEIAKAQLHRSRAAPSHQSMHDGIIATSEKSRVKHYQRAVRMRFWAIVLGLFSLALFVLGAVFAGLVLSREAAAA